MPVNSDETSSHGIANLTHASLINPSMILEKQGMRWSLTENRMIAIGDMTAVNI